MVLTGINFIANIIKTDGKKAKNKYSAQLKVMYAENMELENNLFDMVITTCVYCSVPDPARSFKEIRREGRYKPEQINLEQFWFDIVKLISLSN